MTRGSRLILILAGAAILGSSPGAIRAADSIAPSPETKVDRWLTSRLHQRGSDSFLVLFDTSERFREALGKVARGPKHSPAVYDLLRSRARDVQSDARSWLDAQGIPYRRLYIVNGIQVRGDLDLARALASRPEVARIVGDPLVRGVDSWAARDGSSPNGIEWGVLAVHADSVWNLDGVRGEGIVVASADTGVEWNHPALINKYRGWNGTVATHNFNWHDAIDDLAVPFDDFAHGTHTTGIMVGDDGAGNQIGVAPGARWIACKNMDVGQGQPSTYLECIQFFLAPYPHGGDPELDGDPELAPDIVNNSWSCPPEEGCDPDTLQDAFVALEAAGILAVAAAGNSGASGCSTVDEPPAIYEEALVVGATTSTNFLAFLSSRGPVTVDGSGRLRPDLVAPGISVRSSVPGGGYLVLGGTSMASPHAAGASALLWSARPQFRGLIGLSHCLLTRASNPSVSTTPGDICGGTDGSDRPNNLFGWGLVDAYNTIHLAPDGDVDGVADACDCAAADAGAFDVPGEVHDTLFGSDRVTLSWPSLAPSAGSGTVYDVVRGDLLNLRASGSIVAAACLAGGSSSASFTDFTVPVVGRGLYYVVQARNACGSGGWGTDSAGNPRTHSACP